ncbi:MAG: tetratricopeptide (TPR) repeat protein [Chlamydiales bacterium]|jgi:tetratricopeptide (TPR) repeat protein
MDPRFIPSMRISTCLPETLRRLIPVCALVAALAALTPVLGAQMNGVTREQMWTAPTAEDWARPCLIRWQRTWEDAVAVSKQTGKAILICVNMDGEIASEHYAGIRYRQDEITDLYAPYVTVIASVYRHTPRDHDQEGRRVLCPRFGTVTCGEHIAIEPGLFDQYFEGRRVAPRHIGIELDSEEMYDVYYAFDTDTIFNTLRAGIEGRDVETTEIVHDQPVVTLLDSPDSEDRARVEQAYIDGDRETRRRLLKHVVAKGGNGPDDLLRLAVFGLDLELAKLAQQALANSDSVASIDLIIEALRVPMEASERDALVAALERIGEKSARAKTLATVYQGLARHSEALDVDGWTRALEEVSDADGVEAKDWYALEVQLEAQLQSASERPADGATELDLAESALALAVDPQTAVSLAADRKTTSRYARLMFEDVRTHALEAEVLGQSGWRVDAALAVAAFYLGDAEEAHSRAESAVRSMPGGEQSWNAMAVMAVFADARSRGIARAVAENATWPPEYLTDVNAAYAVLAKHPLGTAEQVLAHYEFLWSMGAPGPASSVLDDGLSRFPASAVLHDRLRGRLLKESGLDALEGRYVAMLAEPGASPRLEWFAGYASLVVAEFHRRVGQRDEARGAYDRAIGHYESVSLSMPELRDNADHYVAMALAGRARLAFEREDFEGALDELRAAFARRPGAAASLDGLGVSAVGTAKLMLGRLQTDQGTDLAGRVQAALDGLDPVLLELPAFEREGPNVTPQMGDRRGLRRKS